MPKGNKLLQKPNKRPTSQVFPHQDDKYDNQKLLFNAIDEQKKSKWELCKDLFKTQTYTFTFEANSSQYNAQTIESNGTIQQIDSPVSYTLSKLTSSSPFKEQLQTGDLVDEGDIVDVELDSQPTSQVKVEVVVSYKDESYSKTLPEDLRGNARYLYTADNQGISCYDLDTHNEIKRFSTNLWGSGGRKQLLYDSIRKEVLLFSDYDSTNPFIINADNEDQNFNTTKSKTFPIGKRQCARVGFIHYENLFFAPDNGRGIEMIDGDTRNKLDVFLSISNPGHARFSALGNIGSVDTALIKVKRNGIELLNEVNGARAHDGIYNPIKGYYVIPERGTIKFIELQTFKVIAVLFTPNYSSLCDLDRSNNIIFGADRNNFYRIDGENIVELEHKKLANVVGENVDTHGAVRWSSYTGLFYVKVEKEESGTNSNPFLLAIDGTKSLDNCIVHKIPLNNPTGKRVVVKEDKDIDLNQMRIC